MEPLKGKSTATRHLNALFGDKTNKPKAPQFSAYTPAPAFSANPPRPATADAPVKTMKRRATSDKAADDPQPKRQAEGSTDITGGTKKDEFEFTALSDDDDFVTKSNLDRKKTGVAGVSSAPVPPNPRPLWQTTMSMYSSPQKPEAPRLVPVGMVNMGNTCYLNAVLQVLFSLPTFVEDLQSLDSVGLPDSGVCAALVGCWREHQAAHSLGSSRPAISPAALKSVLGSQSSRWRGRRQEDAHEFLCALLERVQQEVLGAQVRSRASAAATAAESPRSDAAAAAPAAAEPEGPAGGGPAKAEAREVKHVRLSDALCPAALNFSGCLQHTLTCSSCGHVSKVKEQFSHLSLQVPSMPFTWTSIELFKLLDTHFKEEVIDKACERCSAPAAPHKLHHTIRRLPRVLIVHLKRFHLQPHADGSYTYTKLGTSISVPKTLDLEAFCEPGVPAHPVQLKAHNSAPGQHKQQEQQHKPSMAQPTARGTTAGAAAAGAGGSSTANKPPGKENLSALGNIPRSSILAAKAISGQPSNSLSQLSSAAAQSASAGGTDAQVPITKASPAVGQAGVSFASRSEGAASLIGLLGGAEARPADDADQRPGRAAAEAFTSRRDGAGHSTGGGGRSRVGGGGTDGGAYSHSVDLTQHRRTSVDEFGVDNEPSAPPLPSSSPPFVSRARSTAAAAAAATTCSSDEVREVRETGARLERFRATAAARAQSPAGAAAERRAAASAAAAATSPAAAGRKPSPLVAPIMATSKFFSAKKDEAATSSDNDSAPLLIHRSSAIADDAGGGGFDESNGVVTPMRRPARQNLMVTPDQSQREPFKSDVINLALDHEEEDLQRALALSMSASDAQQGPSTEPTEAQQMAWALEQGHQGGGVPMDVDGDLVMMEDVSDGARPAGANGSTASPPPLQPQVMLVEDSDAEDEATAAAASEAAPGATAAAAAAADEQHTGDAACSGVDDEAPPKPLPPSAPPVASSFLAALQEVTNSKPPLAASDANKKPRRGATTTSTTPAAAALQEVANRKAPHAASDITTKPRPGAAATATTPVAAGDACAAAIPLVTVAEFRLHGVVSHRGRTPFSGHYVADARSPQDQQWYHHDDSVVTSTTNVRTIADAAREGYLLFFTTFSGV